ncbi:4,5-dihydroxyphthalate decarboxylase [Salinisphaera sp. Q1T1-3]|uniref:4,5-dihydroxyphthalate decarboxylase n=1 Tax=Salinisphaera sp. Q1T1-3 TaxID=2321229 RepID=UPI000E71E1B5|nr:4,5-dihydroxyphthalate decarboxylase [Salinisphaera sp. Q1T1-3]RJS93680.1 4,5-dihydroxyphthalate decarboxylase [Salinisphaera sp. Q1T1-3]
MTNRTIDIAFWDYDRTRLLLDGTIPIQGAEPRFHSARIVPQIFKAMIDGHYDVSELGFTYFLRTFVDGRSPFLALPVFLNRAFRHGAIHVNENSSISRPEDLAGKRIGELALYGHDAGLMSKGILSDTSAWRPEQSRWIVGGIDFPMDPVDFVSRPVPAGCEVEYAGSDVDLGEMLVTGEIDALFTADIPAGMLQKRSGIRRLFGDYLERERAYFRDTGIFPIMHLVAVKRQMAENHPELIKSIYQSFCQAKDQMIEHYAQGMTFNNMDLMHPWLTALIAENRELMGKDWWPYGIGANRAAIDTVLRYHHEQGLTDRRFTIEDVFVPGLLET